MSLITLCLILCGLFLVWYVKYKDDQSKQLWIEKRIALQKLQDLVYDSLLTEEQEKQKHSLLQLYYQQYFDEYMNEGCSYSQAEYLAAVKGFETLSDRIESFERQTDLT